VVICPGGDGDWTHSAGLDYSGLWPSLFGLEATFTCRSQASRIDEAKLSSGLKRLFSGCIAGGLVAM
jgi:hypothetical protein